MWFYLQRISLFSYSYLIQNQNITNSTHTQTNRGTDLIICLLTDVHTQIIALQTYIQHVLEYKASASLFWMNSTD